tara:strand:- start:940 stop:1701 length:762 start_codon:yes stop_codon:yes gene_type:complete
MKIEETIFFNNSWRWSSFLKYLIAKLAKYDCSKYNIPSEYEYRKSTFGSKKNKQNVTLFTWGAFHPRINLARAVCIDSPNYSVLNFLIIPNQIYNIPFFGLDFVSLPSKHLLVLDFQPSLQIEKQFDMNLLKRVVRLKNQFHEKIPTAEELPIELSKFFSPGMIWSKLPKDEYSEKIISTKLFTSFQSYLDLYLEALSKSKKVEPELQKEIIIGQTTYLNFRKENDPARPMLKSLFGSEFCESLIQNVLFAIN